MGFLHLDDVPRLYLLTRRPEILPPGIHGVAYFNENLLETNQFMYISPIFHQLFNFPT